MKILNKNTKKGRYISGNGHLSHEKELAKIISDTKLKDLVKTFVAHLEESHKLDSKQIADLFEKRIIKKDLLPISIFDNNELSCLESIVKYLKEELELKLHEIALLLNRDDRTIWTTYNFACKKRKKRLQVKESKILIPISIFTNRKLSVLESIIGYLKDNFNLRYSEIAALLNRDERNIWTVYNRYKKKNE